jgi:2-polyprenyl-3-methyl-5-hydroxy-6-metoxy-1,4-benzoquinol methylase
MAPTRSLYLTDLAYIHDRGFGDLANGVASQVVRILNRHGIRRGRIVEAGCGSGILARHLADAGHDVIGIDASPAMIRLARVRAPNARFRVASVTTASIPRCDAVIAIGEVTTYLRSGRAVQQFISRVRTALRPGGLFLFDFIESGERRHYPPKSRGGEGWAIVAQADLSRNRRVITRRLTMFRKVGRRYRKSRETHRVRVYPREEIAAMLARAGFACEMRRSFGNHRLIAGDVAVIARPSSR